MLARDEQPAAVIERVDLVDVVERALARVRRRAPGAHFDVDLAPWAVMGDAAELERAVTNLLDNAAKWSRDGTITVSLDGVLTVDDDGPGVAEADRPTCSTGSGAPPSRASMPGSGLGLAIVRHVVERHGGQVKVETAPSGGARFALWLPAAADFVAGDASPAGHASS